MQAIEQGLYQGGDGSNFAYVVLSAIAPSSLNIVRVKFGYKVSDCQSTLYRLIDGQLYDETTREWRTLIDDLIPGTSYDFIAYTEQSKARLSDTSNPTLTLTTQGERTINVTNLASWLSPYFLSYSEDIGFHNEAYTISSGVFTLVGNYRMRRIKVYPEISLSSDDLDKIVGVKDGDIILLYTEPGETIVVKDDPFFFLSASGDCTLVGNDKDTLMLMADVSGNLYELARGEN